MWQGQEVLQGLKLSHLTKSTITFVYVLISKKDPMAICMNITFIFINNNKFCCHFLFLQEKDDPSQSGQVRQ